MDRLNTLITTLKANPPNYAEPSSVKDWFLHNDIRVSYPEEGDATSLWFCLADVGQVIGDQNYRRYKSKYTRSVEMNDKNGRCQTYIMLTEQGLYHYLLRSNRPAAEPFQDWVFDLLTIVRREVVTKAEYDLLMAKRVMVTLNRSIKMRDHNFKVMANIEGRRIDYCLTEPQDPAIIERCYLHGIDCTLFTRAQLTHLRERLQWSEPYVVDDVLVEWGMISAKQREQHS